MEGAMGMESRFLDGSMRGHHLNALQCVPVGVPSAPPTSETGCLTEKALEPAGSALPLGTT